jgi:rubrerythrin
LLTKKIEEHPSQYFVCQNCGSTLSKIPEFTCPICGGPSANYKEIK